LPELPEVETIAADLRPHLVGRTVTGCEVRFPTIVRHPDPDRFAAELVGRRIEAVGRRGKYILHHLSGHDGDGTLLVVHLGMTGQWRCVQPEAPEPDHLHAVVALDDGRQLRYRDTRRFGRLLLGSETELVAARKLPRLGPEPLGPELTAAGLYRRLHVRRAPLKALLLDQRVVAGLGNIYADESCFRAGVRPERAGSSLSRRAVGRLHAALGELLREAIANRGSSVSTYRDAWGDPGGEQELLQVYGRGGEPCVRCGRPLSVVRLAGRTTVYCRRCQR
jgi:formamidopyrimidine-DNA glycosylase